MYTASSVSVQRQASSSQAAAIMLQRTKIVYLPGISTQLQQQSAVRKIRANLQCAMQCRNCRGMCPHPASRCSALFCAAKPTINRLPLTALWRSQQRAAEATGTSAAFHGLCSSLKPKSKLFLFFLLYVFWFSALAQNSQPAR